MKKNIWADVGVVLLLGMTPLLWFSPGSFLLSVDFTLPFTWDRWYNEYFHTWNHALGAGYGYKLISSTHFFFLVQIFFQWLGMDLLTTQKAVFVFWFTLPGLSFYYLARYLFRELPPNHYRKACLVSVVFYMFNLYLEPIWIGLNVSNLLAYAFLPLLLRVFIETIEEKKNPLLSAFWIGCISLPSSGILCNPAILLISLAVIIFFIILYLFNSKRSWNDLFHLFVFIFFSILFMGVFNFYWLLTEFLRVFKNPAMQEVSLASGQIIDAWLAGVSKFTSLYNVVRMQGDWTWYAGYRNYSSIYQHNLFFILLSWLLPILAGWGMFFKSRYRHFFGILLATSLLFSMGTHSFFAPVYRFCVNHIPFFWVIRSPWYKFGILTCLGYAFFLGLATSKLLNFLERKQNFSKFQGIIFVLLILFAPVYAFPVTTGKIFVRPSNGGYTNHVQVPDYVYESGKWMNQQEGDFRIFDLPGKGVFHNRWGYQGFTPFATYLSNHPVLFEDQTLSIPKMGSWGTSWSPLVILIHNALDKRLSPNLHRLLALFNVQYMLFEKDYKFETLPLPTTAEEIQNHIRHQSGMKLLKSFGNLWDFYQVEETLPSLYMVDRVVYVEDNIDTFIPLSNKEEIKNAAYFFAGLTNGQTKEKLFQERQIDNLILHDKTLFDVVIDFIKEDKKINIAMSEDNHPQEAKISIPKKEKYLVFARKSFPISSAALRVLVDLTPLPQRVPIDWNPAAATKNQGNWIAVDGEPLSVVHKPDLATKKYQSGESWLFLGEISLNSGEHQVQVLGENQLQGSYEMKWISENNFHNQFSLIESALDNPRVQYQLFLTTRRAWNHGGQEEASRMIIYPSEKLSWEPGEGLTEKFPFRGEDSWFRLDEGKEALKIYNDSGKERAVKIQIELFIAQPVERTLYVHLNKKEIWQQSLETQKNHKILLSLTLPPGTHQIRFKSNGTPEVLDRLFHDGDKRKANFLVRNILIGDKAYKDRFQVPARQKFYLSIYPFQDRGEKEDEFNDRVRRPIKIDGETIYLHQKEQKSGSRFWRSETAIHLAKGWHEIEFLEMGGNGYFVEVSSAENLPKDSEVPTATYQRLSPSLCKGKITAPKGGWLIFCEAYDLRWELKVNNKIYQPALINGYANGFYLEPLWEEPVNFELSFSVQPWFTFGLKCSGVAFAATAAGFGIWGVAAKVQSRRRRRKEIPKPKKAESKKKPVKKKQ